MNNRTDSTEAIREDLGNLREDIAGLTRALKDGLDEQSQDAFERLRHSAEAGREQISKARDAAAAQVEQRPLSSIILALGLGLLIGMLFDRRM